MPRNSFMRGQCTTGWWATPADTSGFLAMTIEGHECVARAPHEDDPARRSPSPRQRSVEMAAAMRASIRLK